jgi:hypothetical protein
VPRGAAPGDRNGLVRFNRQDNRMRRIDRIRVGAKRMRLRQCLRHLLFHSVDPANPVILSNCSCHHGTQRRALPLLSRDAAEGGELHPPGEAAARRAACRMLRRGNGVRLVPAVLTAAVRRVSKAKRTGPSGGRTAKCDRLCPGANDLRPRRRGHAATRSDAGGGIGSCDRSSGVIGRVLCGYPNGSPLAACFACPWGVCVL